jgi:putative ABC transport system permease protein
MFLAIREIRRGLVRFTLLALAIGLLLFLVLFQQALQDGLLTSFVGALRNQSAPVLVYSVDGQRTLQGSVIPPELERAVIAVDGVADHNRLAQGTFTARTDEAEPADASIIGTDGPLGQPTSVAQGRRPAVAGEALASSADFAVGDTVRVVADEPVTLTVVGLADDVQLSVTPTLFTDLATYEAAVRSVNPDATDVPASALALSPVGGVTPDNLARRVNAAVPDADAVTREEAADTTPGVAQVRQSFRVIFALYALVVPLVTGLFFLILTLQKRRSLTLLRAIGARPGVVTRALVVQVLLVTGAGLVVGTALFAPLGGRRIGGLVLRFDVTAVVAWAALFLVLALLGAVASLRRVLQVDPLEATNVGAAG